MKAPNYLKKHRSQGMVLIVVLIMLGILTLIVAALVRTGNINFRIAGNQQYRQEARLSAQQGIEAYVATASNFADNDHTASTSPPTATNTVTMDLDGDGTNEYSATVPPATYLGERLVLYKEVPETDTDCGGYQANVDLALGGVPGSAPPLNQQARCRDMVWDVKATVTDAATGVAVELHQGVTSRTLK